MLVALLRIPPTENQDEGKGTTSTTFQKAEVSAAGVKLTSDKLECSYLDLCSSSSLDCISLLSCSSTSCSFFCRAADWGERNEENHLHYLSRDSYRKDRRGCASGIAMRLLIAYTFFYYNKGALMTNLKALIYFLLVSLIEIILIC